MGAQEQRDEAVSEEMRNDASTPSPTPRALIGWPSPANMPAQNPKSWLSYRALSTIAMGTRYYLFEGICPWS
jgi:hypothetical protein